MAEGLVRDRIYVDSKVDPGDMGVNLRFRGNQVIHPRAREARDTLVRDIVHAADGQLIDLGKDTWVSMSFTFRTRRFDIDGPIKRTLDALQLAMKQEVGYDDGWNDNRVTAIYVTKEWDRDNPGITIVAKKIGS